ncbi:tetratricopeptide repeat protein 12-like [Phymastichus coffea]|uniref:tetratricopeptide repeat protein 12-like n=1 Tax=Phymastichus coffea TaxID=108790 RepID=UPI00273BE92F|nr:tetratricopeptide repeat protein 12-like [Phymastichus coffea]XP_058800264.1 tetratricopeptide repeat protein 12-like [Phymastichus coffea]XP_058800265.1 tetratricopeptide repeat protein 12-like [Phymastichus coffea]
MENDIKLDNLNSCMNEEVSKVFSNMDEKRKGTEEEFQNFMHRVTEVEKIIKQLSSENETEQRQGIHLADEILGKSRNCDISEDEELKIKSNRTLINTYSAEDADPNQMSQEAFKRSVEKDAQARSEDRKTRNERAETYKRIGNGAFKESNYEKAVTYFTKALDQRRDSTVLWNNRALAYMKLSLFEKALLDCEWALKVNEANIKALLNSAKCHRSLGNHVKCKEFIALAKDKNPYFLNYIAEFEKNLESKAANNSD